MFAGDTVPHRDCDVAVGGVVPVVAETEELLEGSSTTNRACLIITGAN